MSEMCWPGGAFAEEMSELSQAWVDQRPEMPAERTAGTVT